MHTHIKLEAHAPLNINHSYCVNSRSLYSSVVFRSLLLQRCLWGVICSSWPLGVCCSSVDFRSYAPALILGVYTPALLEELFPLTRWLVPHAYCIVELLLRCCIVVNVELLLLLLFQMLSRNKWSICEILMMISICELLLLFKLLNSVDELYTYYYWMWNLTPSVWMLPLRW